MGTSPAAGGNNNTEKSNKETAAAGKRSHSAGDFWFDFLAGGLSGGVSKTAVAPIERVKLLLQTQDSHAKIVAGNVQRYTGIIDCTRRVVQEQGIRSLWRGNLANVLRYFPTQAFNFAFRDSFKSLFPKYDKNENFLKLCAANAAAGGMAGAASLTLVYPLDMARTRLAADFGSNAAREFNGIWDVLSKVTKKSGPFGLYRGIGVSIPGIFVYRAAYFGIYDSAKPVVFANNKNPSFLSRWMVAQASTTAAGLICYPFDTVRRRLMVATKADAALQAAKADAPGLYKGTIDCFTKIVKKEGFKALYRGGFANVVRGTGGALVLVLYDQFQQVMYS